MSALKLFLSNKLDIRISLELFQLKRKPTEWNQLTSDA